MEIDEAIAYLRRQAGQVETIYYAHVLDTDQRLLGTVSFRDLLSARRDRNVQQVMRRQFQSVRDNERHEAVAKLISDHRLLAIPVLDKSRVMQGIVTIDDAMQESRDSADEQLQKVGGMEALEGACLGTTFGRMFRKRVGWLSALFFRGNADGYSYRILRA